MDEESKEAASALRLEVECLKQELDKKSLALVSAQSELSTVTEVSKRSCKFKRSKTQCIVIYSSVTTAFNYIAVCLLLDD